MRAAVALRCPTSPARFAMRMPSTATGMTMAMSVNAASTSTSVKAACAHLMPDIGRIVGLHFILQAIGAFHNPDRIDLTLTKQDAARAGFTDETIGSKANHRHIADARCDLVQLTRRRNNRGRLQLNPHLFVQRKTHCVTVTVSVAGLLLQTVGTASCINP